MASAATKVFETYELLETILAALPPRSILLVKRTCKNWLSVTAKSTNLGRLMFLLPSSDPVQPEVKWPATNGTEGITIIKYGQELHFNRIFLTVLPASSKPISEIFVDTNAYLIRCVLPLVGPAKGEDTAETGTTEIRSIADYPPGAMFLTQPPCTTVLFTVIKVDQEKDGQGEAPETPRCTIFDPNGIRLGLLAHVASSMTEREGTEIIAGEVKICMPITAKTKEIWREDAKRWPEL